MSLLNNKENLLENFGLSACLAIREMVLPGPKQIKTTKDNSVFVVTCDEQGGKKVNILSKKTDLFSYLNLLQELYENSEFFLCERNLRLDNYIPCKKVNYGFYYRFKSEKYKIDSFVSTVISEKEYSQKLKDIFMEQKKINCDLNLERWLVNENKTICVAKGNELAGFIVLSRYHEQFFINAIYVCELYRHLGIGTELLMYASNYVNENGGNYFYGMSPYKMKDFYNKLNVDSFEGWILWRKKNA